MENGESKSSEATEIKKIKTISPEEKLHYRKKLFSVIDHVRNVNSAAQTLAERLIENAESHEDLEFARRLVQKVRRHDLSKFEGIEWDSLHRETEDKKLLKMAIEQHQQTNDHHPEYFVGGIHQMNKIQLGELVCDWYARSHEMGTDLRVFIKEKASERFGFTLQSKPYKTIKQFVDLLLDDQFK